MTTQGGEAIIGREHPAAVLRAEISRAAESHGGLVLVTGEAGIGKTTLVTSAADEARRRGALVLSASCWYSDSAPGYWPWVQILRRLRRSVEPDEWAAAQANAGGLSVLLGEGGPAHAADSAGDARRHGHAARDDNPDVGSSDEFELYDGVNAALVSAAQRRPVVVVLDDLHWADAASLRLLEFVAQHTWFERLLLIGTYRDAEVEAADHPLHELIMSLVAKARTVTLTGLEPHEVGTLMARTAGRDPELDLVDEVYRRTGGNPFFVEQTARLWGADGDLTAVAPGVRDAIRRRLTQLPEAVLELLSAAAVLGREFHRQVLAASAGSPAAEVDRLLDRAAVARLVVARTGGRFAFAHDLVRETLYDGLDEGERRSRHAAVIRAVEQHAGLAERFLPAELARHAYLAGPDLPASSIVERLLAAARDASARMATEEAFGHFRRALEVVEDPEHRARITLELGGELYHSGDRAMGWRHFEEAAVLAREIDDPDLLARVALTVYRRQGTSDKRAEAAHDLLREAHGRLVGGTTPGQQPERLVWDLIAGTEASARRGRNDEALTFSLWTRHHTMWGPGTAREREALTVELGQVARRSADRDAELFAASLRWVALVELGDARYYDQFQTFVALADRESSARWRLGRSVDRSIIAGLRGEFAEAGARLAELDEVANHDHPEFAFMVHHLPWALLMLQGGFAEADALLRPLSKGDHPYVGLLRGLTAVERGNFEPALHHIAEVEASGKPYDRFMTPLWLRLQAQTAAATHDPALSERAYTALAPFRGEWVVSMYGCDISGPVDLWMATVDAAMNRWEDAIAGFTLARESADRLGARPWSIYARAGLADALLRRGGAGDVGSAELLWREVDLDAAEIGMRHIVERAQRRHMTTSPVPTISLPSARTANDHPESIEDDAGYEFRREGAVWRLAYGEQVVHMPSAKGLDDLHLLLSRPGAAIAAVEMLDPAAGPELVAARRMGSDPVLDDEAKARYRRRLTELDEAIDRAAERGDDDGAVAFDKERQALLDELRAAAGLAGRTRRLGDEAERARKTVSARIRDSLRRLDDIHPALAAHLRETVSTGATCVYAPAEPTQWRL